MMISPYSILMSLLWFTVAALIGSFTLRRAEKHGPALVAAIYLLAFLRGALPLDFDQSIVISSYKIYPMLQDALTAPIYGRMTAGRCLITLWGAGTAVQLCRFLLKLMRQKKFLCGVMYEIPSSELFILLDEVCSELGYHGKSKLTVSSKVSTAYQAGFLCPHILLPIDTASCSEVDIRNIFRHELCHFLGGDLWIKAGMEISACLLWWNPVIPFLKHSVVQLLELLCDKRACKGRSSAEQVEYVETLLRFVKSSVADPANLTLSYLGNTQNADIKQRFQLMLQDRSSTQSRFRVWGSCIVCFMLFVASYFVILQPAGFPPPIEDDVAITVLTPENAYILQMQDGTLVLYYNNTPYDVLITKDMLRTEPLSSLPIISERIDEQ